eukprot:12146956-Alexandrium_andersonii.AAC.1
MTGPTKCEFPRARTTDRSNAQRCIQFESAPACISRPTKDQRPHPAKGNGRLPSAFAPGAASASRGPPNQV